MALLAGKHWLNYSILLGVIKLLQKKQIDTSVFMLNDLIQMDGGNVHRTIQQYNKRTRYVTLIANVGKLSEVFFGTDLVVTGPARRYDMAYVSVCPLRLPQVFDNFLVDWQEGRY